MIDLCLEEQEEEYLPSPNLVGAGGGGSGFYDTGLSWYVSDEDVSTRSTPTEPTDGVLLSGFHLAVHHFFAPVVRPKTTMCF